MKIKNVILIAVIIVSLCFVVKLWIDNLETEQHTVEPYPMIVN